MTITVARNPMGFYCPPNGADPAYASETDFRNFVAYGLLRCYTDFEPHCFREADKMTDDLIRELRDAFLNVLEGTLQFLWTGEFEVGQENFDNDMFGDGTDVLIGEENDDCQLMISWRPFAIREDCIIFDMDCAVLVGEGINDPTTIYLDMAAIEDRQAVKDIIAEAHKLNAYPYRTKYQNEQNEKLWQQILS